MSILVHEVELRELDVRTRMPFRYGIAEMRALPHVLVLATCEVDGKVESGIAADGLAPKWFTKDPASSIDEDLQGMRRVIRSAASVATGLGAHATAFRWWRELLEAQRASAGSATPPLLWNFGVSLIERAVIHAYCRRHGMSFAAALRANLFGIDLGSIHPQLTAAVPAGLLPPQPLRRCLVRHTVGLSDPLTDADIAPGERVDDGLPQSLQASIRAYGLRRFKIKLCGNLAKDLPRLRSLRGVLDSSVQDGKYAFTLDGNEQFKSVSEFREHWQAIRSDPELQTLMRRLIFVEQPIQRDQAMEDFTRSRMVSWSERPPVIIDESDGELSSLPRALECGYAGASHKNCKGIFKGIANACLIAHLRRSSPEKRFEFSGEDLANIGPVALLQDLAVCASLGLEHVERNGHHYFNGLSMWPQDVQQKTLAMHPDLYRRSAGDIPTLSIEDGSIDLTNVVEAAFGIDAPLDVRPFRQW